MVERIPRLLRPASREPGFCNRRENRGEQGGGFFDEKSESVALTTVELFSEEKVPHCSTNSASYCKFRVEQTA
ncbi:MAG: hypothetical protein A2314_03380 [Elusimicrobia bacterium RIFOXYB2_FULL_50_12]|nr:MAG: hypothetical protein A2314_03380 [Elusimicrobia bacterium RIFOXYB2_FULL_50_12]